MESRLPTRLYRRPEGILRRTKYLKGSQCPVGYEGNAIESYRLETAGGRKASYVDRP